MKTLIVEDDAATRRGLAEAIQDFGGEPRAVGTAKQALDALAEFRPQLLLVDISLPDGDGLEILRAAREAQPEMEAVVLTGSNSVDHAIEALRAGATDYLLKPLRPAQLEAVYARIAERRRLEFEVDALRTELQETGRLGEMVGRSQAMKGVFEDLRKVAGTNAPVLISGPSGSGKEVAARTIHRLSRRAGKAFVAFNCGAVSPTLIESELFGHERGSFTGADRRRVGYFEEANGGTLFLDEITEMSAELQVRLLRVLEERSLRRVGGSQDIAIDVRLALRDESGSAGCAQGGEAAGGSLLSAQRLPALPASAQGSAGRHRHAGRRVSQADRGSGKGRRASLGSRGSRSAPGLRLARQRARAAQHGPSRLHRDGRRHDPHLHGERPSAPGGPGRVQAQAVPDEGKGEVAAPHGRPPGRLTTVARPPSAWHDFRSHSGRKGGPFVARSERRSSEMLWTIFVILLVLWLLGLVSGYTLSGFIHILLVIAVVVLVIRLIQGRNVV